MEFSSYQDLQTLFGGNVNKKKHSEYA